MSNLTTLFQQSARSSSQHNKRRNGNERKFAKKLLKSVTEFIKATGSISIQISIVFLYNNNEHVDTEIKTSIPFTISQKKILRHKSKENLYGICMLETIKCW